MKRIIVSYSNISTFEYLMGTKGISYELVTWSNTYEAFSVEVSASVYQEVLSCIAIYYLSQK